MRNLKWIPIFYISRFVRPPIFFQVKCLYLKNNNKSSLNAQNVALFKQRFSTRKFLHRRISWSGNSGAPMKSGYICLNKTIIERLRWKYYEIY